MLVLLSCLSLFGSFLLISKTLSLVCHIILYVLCYNKFIEAHVFFCLSIFETMVECSFPISLRFLYLERKYIKQMKKYNSILLRNWVSTFRIISYYNCLYIILSDGYSHKKYDQTVCFLRIYDGTYLKIGQSRQ